MSDSLPASDPLRSPSDVARTDARKDEDGRAARGTDRRSEPTARLSGFSLRGGRRTKVRRDGEREGAFVDLYGLRLWGLIVWIALMNVADSWFTLVHLQAGGIELNPVADWLLSTGRWNFVLSKSALIAAALVVLCLHKNFFLARIGLVTAAATYTLLVVYHLTLFRIA